MLAVFFRLEILDVTQSLTRSTMLTCLPTLQNRMTRDVLAHLRAISAQQSKIRGLRNKLAILREAAARHADALGEFRVVRATAVAYSQCLAECMRRYVPLELTGKFSMLATARVQAAEQALSVFAVHA